jgi:hypothetical protein
MQSGTGTREPNLTNRARRPGRIRPGRQPTQVFSPKAKDKEPPQACDGQVRGADGARAPRHVTPQVLRHGLKTRQSAKAAEDREPCNAEHPVKGKHYGKY